MNCYMHKISLLPNAFCFKFFKTIRYTCNFTDSILKLDFDFFVV